jgi:hypothetical protein
MKMKMLAPSVAIGTGTLFDTVFPYEERNREYWATYLASPLPLGAFEQLQCTEGNQPFDNGPWGKLILSSRGTSLNGLPLFPSRNRLVLQPSLKKTMKGESTYSLKLLLRHLVPWALLLI